MTKIPKNYKPTQKEKFMSAKMKKYFGLKLLVWKNELLKESSQTLVNLQKEENILNVILSNNNVNSISLRMLKELHKVLDNHNLDKKRCIVFSSNQKHFCAGADLKEKSGFSYNQTLDFLDSLIHHLIDY